MDDAAGGVEVDERILARSTKKAARDFRDRELDLVAHAAGGGKSIVGESEMMEKERRRTGASSGGESSRDGENAIGEKRSGEGLIGGDEGSHLGAAVHSGILEEDVFDDSLVDHRTGVLEQRDKGTILEMAVAPEVDSRRVAMVFDELAMTKADVGKEVVVGGGSNESGTNSKKRHVDRPEILESRADRVERVKANQGLIGVSATIERGNQLNNQATDGLVELARDHEEEGVVGEEGDDKGVDEKDPIRDREVLENVLSPLHPGDRLLEGVLENIGQCHLTTDDNPQVGSRRTEGQVGPGATEELGTENVKG